MSRPTTKEWIQSGSPWVWLNGGAIAVSMILVFGLLMLIAARGLVYFWPKEVIQFEYSKPGGVKQTVIGEVHNIENVPAVVLKDSATRIPENVAEFERYLVKKSRVPGQPTFANYLKIHLSNLKTAPELVVVERRVGGKLFGYLHSLKEKNKVVAKGEEVVDIFGKRLDYAQDLVARVLKIEKSDIGSNNYQKEKLNLQKLKLDHYKSKDTSAYEHIKVQKARLEAEYKKLNSKRLKLIEQSNRDILVVRDAQKQLIEVKLANVVRIYQPNKMSVFGKSWLYVERFWEFLTDDPREANTEGGIYPAILGTVVMVILMSILVTPLGVIAAIYLREYAKQGPITRLVRISVNNLAGVPSIVYGVFGLGFFVYIVGGGLDAFFFPEREGYKTTFGSPALIWASLTLALLTLPVVIVATEEGLSRVPRSIREGSLALGATKAETLWRTVIPMASPGIMTGLILAIARAAGEVAPLMLVGVVKYSPSPPVDLNAPFVHFDRTIMHLGFHIYDVGFQSPDSEAARPLVYATALILVMVIVVLNLTAIRIRNKLRERYRALEH